MYTWLLAGSDADCLAVFYKAYGVGLCIFQNDQRNFKITFCLFCKSFVFGYDVWDQFIIDCKFLTSLLKSHTKYLFVFQRRRYIVRVDLDHIVISFFLLFQNFQCFFCISRCDYTIRNFSLDQHCCILITDIRKRNKITERGHSVRTSCSCICTCKRRKLFPVHIIYPVDLCKCLCKRKSYRSTSRRNMFERSSRRKSCGFFKITYKLPAVKCIKKINISRFSGQNFDRKIFSLFHVDSGRFLIRVASVF